MSRMLPFTAVLVVTSCAKIALCQTAASSSASLREAVPLEPISAVLEALGSYPIVVLGEAHNEPRVHAFRLALIRHAKFPSLVDDIVLESGASQFQDDMDRFVRGEAMPDTFLRQVLSRAAPTFLHPMYEDIPRTVRVVRGTPLGVADFAFYHSFGQWRLKDGQPVLVNGSPTYDPPRPGLRMEEQVDAVLYLGR